MGMLDMSEVINGYEIKSYGFKEVEENISEESEDFDLGDYEINFDDFDDIFSIDETVENGSLNSVNIGGNLEKVIFNEYENRNYLTLDIKNIHDEKSYYFKITFFDDDAIEYKNYFDVNEYYTFFNLVLTIAKNKKTNTVNPRLVFDKNNNSYC